MGLRQRWLAKHTSSTCLRHSTPTGISSFRILAASEMTGERINGWSINSFIPPMFSRTLPACGVSITWSRQCDALAQKVLFGSDGPWLHPGVELHKVRLPGLSPEKESLILGGNLIRIL